VRKVIDFGWLHLLQHANEIRRISQVAVMQKKPPARDMRISIKMVDPRTIE
jgi:hypothetical protein